MRRSVVLAVTFVLVTAEVALCLRINLWPLLFYESTRWGRRLEILGPFVQWYENPYESALSIRPIVSVVTEKATGNKRAYMLSPLGSYFSSKEHSRFRIIPVVFYERIARERGEEVQHTYLTFFWGRTQEGERYWGFFPFFGCFKGRFGAKKIEFFLWPLYSSVEKSGYTSVHLLWPVFNYTRGNGTFALKVWPFFGYRREPRLKRTFVLWPFFIKETRVYPYVGVEEKKMFFPFWIKEKNPYYEKVSVLWPFFQDVKSTDGSYSQVDYFWPFVRVIRGSQMQETRVFPFYGTSRKEDEEYRFLLWPLYEERRFKRGTEEELTVRILLVSKFWNLSQGGRDVGVVFRVWPLFTAYQNIEGMKAFYGPILLPFHDEGIERNYGALLRIFEFYQFPDGTKFLNILWGLYRYEATAEETVHELAFLLRVRKQKEGYEVSLLQGLLGFGKRKDDFFLKLFWLTL